MTRSLLFLLYFIFLFISIYNLTQQYRAKKIITARISFHTAFILYYILIPMISIILIGAQESNLSGTMLRVSNSDDIDLIYAFLVTAIFYFVFMISYKVTVKKTTISSFIEIKKHDNLDELVENSFQVRNRIYQLAVFSGIICLLLGLFAQTLIVDSLGGIINTAKMGDKLRAYGVNNNMYIPASRLFAITLMPIVLASPYFFLYALRIKKAYNVKVLLTLSLSISILFFLIDAGRIAVIVFLLTFFLDFAFRKSKHPYVYMVAVSIGVLVLLGLLDDLFFYLSYGFIKESSNSGIVPIVNEFAFPYLNLVNIIKINGLYGLRWGVDFITWVVNIIPSKILDVFGLSKVQTGYHFITEYYLGTNASGGIPTDFITLGMRQFGVLGLPLVAFTISRIIKFMDSVILNIHNRNLYFMTLRIASITFLIVPYGDIDSFIRNRFDMIIVFLFLVVVRRIKLKASKSLEKSRINNEI